MCVGVCVCGVSVCVCVCVGGVSVCLCVLVVWVCVCVCVSVCVEPPTVNLNQLALSINFISTTITNNMQVIADSIMHISHKRPAQFSPLGLRPLTRCQKGAITIPSLAMSYVKSAM